MIPSYKNVLHPTLPWYLVQCGNNSKSSYKTVMRVQGFEHVLKRVALEHYELEGKKCRIVNELTKKVVYCQKCGE